MAKVADSADAQPEIIRVVLDTNVLFPATIRTQLVLALDAGRFVGIWSEWIIGELFRTLALAWLDRHGYTRTSRRAMGQSANTMMRVLAPRMELVSFTATGSQPWPDLESDDHPIWQTAIVGNAAYVVSDNVSDYPPATMMPDGTMVDAWQGIRYMKAREFLSWVWPEDELGFGGDPTVSASRGVLLRQLPVIGRES